jgi:hypothetical protein
MLCVRVLRQYELIGNVDNARVSAHGVDLVSLTDPTLLLFGSTRSGAAMALVLSGHEAWRIMLAGRWQSQAFLVYIHEQIQEFSKGVSERMTSNPDFYHVPDIDAWAAGTREPPHVAANIFDGNTNMPRLTALAR